MSMLSLVIKGVRALSKINGFILCKRGQHNEVIVREMFNIYKTQCTRCKRYFVRNIEDSSSRFDWDIEWDIAEASYNEEMSTRSTALAMQEKNSLPFLH